MAKTIHIFGGGTIQHVRNHLALCAPAYGHTARRLRDMCFAKFGDRAGLSLHLTKMADPDSAIETNDDVKVQLNGILTDPSAGAIVFNCAICDFQGRLGDIPSGKYAERLKSRDGIESMTLTPAPKLLATVKAARPDIFLVGFKTTAGAGLDDQLFLTRRQIQETGADLVLANDTVTRKNLLVAKKGMVVEDTREQLLAQMVEILEALQ